MNLDEYKLMVFLEDGTQKEFIEHVKEFTHGLFCQNNYLMPMIQYYCSQFTK